MSGTSIATGGLITGTTSTINWTDAEKEQIRSALGVDGTKTTTIDGEIITKIDIVDAIADRLLTASEVRQCSVIDAAATSLAFETSLTETGNTFWKRAAILMTSGANKGQVRAILSWNGTSHKITVKTPLDHAPANGDLFIILPERKFLTPDIEDIIAEVWEADLTTYTTSKSAGWFVRKIKQSVDSILGLVA